MNLPHRPAVEHDDALGRRVANLARIGATLVIVIFVFAVSAWQVWSGTSHRDVPIAGASATIDIAPAAVEPNEHDHAQRAYVTYGG